MTDDRSSDLLSALPRSRPHRRSAKRPARENPTPEAEAQQVTKETGKSARPEPKARATKAAKPRSRAAKPSKPSKPRSGSGSASKPAASSARAIESAGEAQTRPSRQSKRLPQPAQPRGVPQASQGERPEASTEFPVLRTALQAAAELTEIGVTLSGKALRRALGRFPRP